ncbi:MAG: TonB C-terminal domain-containing protein [Verrucomicrobiales bacterium]|nr:TonB C-terminal domain-containing protein [Verrucomicrobiales bacterium]
MVPQAPIRRRRNSSKVNLLISLVFHGAIIVALFYFAAREGLLGKELKKIAVEMVKEKPPEEKKPEPEKPSEEVAKQEPKEPEPVQETPPPAPLPTTSARDATVAAPPPADPSAPPVMAPPSVEVPSFTFGGGRAVRTSSDPVQLYKGFLEYSLRSQWNRPADVEDRLLVAEVEVSVDAVGRISNPSWKKGSGHERWDASVRQAIAATPTVNRAPPTNFPPRVLVRFDVLEVEDAAGETP